MNNKCIKILLILVSSLMAQAAFSNTFHSVDTLSRLATDREIVGADANITDRYTLCLPARFTSNPANEKVCFGGVDSK